MKTDRKFFKNALAGCIAAAGMASLGAQAYGPLYIWDFESGTPYRWDVTNPVPVYTDGGNFASGTVMIRVQTPETCNAENGWKCSHLEELYVEFTNEQGVARVEEALASWSSVPTSSFQAEWAGSFASLGLGGADGDITGAAEEFALDGNGNVIHEILGTVNGGGIHVVFDEDGSVMTNVLGVPEGVLGVASPEWADESTGIITEGWVFIGGAQTYYNDEDLAHMAGVVTHELGHSFNLAHSQTNGQIWFFGNQMAAAPGPLDCSAHPLLGGAYQLPFPKAAGPFVHDVEVMYPYISNNPLSSRSTGAHQASVSTREDFAAISSLYPADDFAATTGSISGTVTYPFSRDGIIGVNIVARNIDNPYEDAITVMTGDWNDGVSRAAQGVGEFTLQGLTPGARYVVHAENIIAGGFPTPQARLPGPTEYWNGNGENDDATSDNACDYEEIIVAGGETRTGIDIQINGMKKAPRLVINPAPNGDNVTENGQVTAGTIIDAQGQTQGWMHHASTDAYAILPMGSLKMSDNGSVVSGITAVGLEMLPARMIPGHTIEVLPSAGNVPCEAGYGIIEHYTNRAISPNGEFMGGFLWNCEVPAGEPGHRKAAAAIWSEKGGWNVLNSHLDDESSRVNALANDGTAVGWETLSYGWRDGAVWKGGQELRVRDFAPADMLEVGEALAITSDGSTVVGVNAINANYDTRGWMFDTVTGTFTMLDIFEPCAPWDWICFGGSPFGPQDISDDRTIVGAIGKASASQATIFNEVLGVQKLAGFLKGQGVMNANDLGVVSNAMKISSNGRHIVGWTGADGVLASFKLTLDQLWVCRNGKSMQVGYPGGVASQLKAGATLGLCEADLPLQYKGNL